MPTSRYQKVLLQAKQQWKLRFPWITQIEQALGPALPRSSTFYCGVAPLNGFHVFVNFQNNRKPRGTFLFTVNILLSEAYGPPEPWIRQASDHGQFSVGSHRLGEFVDGHDRWWSTENRHVSRTTREMMNIQRATKYDDEKTVVTELVDILSNDIERYVFRPLGYQITSEQKTT